MLPVSFFFVIPLRRKTEDTVVTKHPRHDGSDHRWLTVMLTANMAVLHMETLIIGQSVLIRGLVILFICAFIHLSAFQKPDTQP